jgi:riboflavin kinase/FMN adenylyltransferase
MAMRVARSLEEWRTAAGASLGERTVVTIGNFDGVHVGHREILRRVVERARETANLAAVVTFDPHPMKVLRPAEAPGLLSTMAQRLQEMEKLGIEAALVLRFDAELARVSPEDFVRTILAETLKMSVVFVGENFRFGHKHAGDVKLLRELGRKHDYRVEILEPVVMAGEIVSSTAVRVAVAEGDMETAARLLGRPYALSGEIRRGTGTGARLVFPTLNLAPEQEIFPARGVYATETFVEGRGYRSATNVGVRPTFDGKTLTIESHLFDFEQEVTAGPMQVWFWKRLRGEQKFSGPEELRGQIAKDLEETKAFFRHLDRTRGAQQTA